MSTKWGSQEGDYPSDMSTKWGRSGGGHDNDFRSSYDFKWATKFEAKPIKRYDPQCNACSKATFSFYICGGTYYCAQCFVNLCDKDSTILFGGPNAERHRTLYLCAQRELDAAGMTEQQVREQLGNFFPDLANKC